MIRCVECPSFAICVHRVKVRKYPNPQTKSYYTILSVFDTTELHDCIHFQEQFKNRDDVSNQERIILKQAILEAQGLV